MPVVPPPATLGPRVTTNPSAAPTASTSLAPPWPQTSTPNPLSVNRSLRVSPNMAVIRPQITPRARLHPSPRVAAALRQVRPTYGAGHSLPRRHGEVDRGEASVDQLAETVDDGRGAGLRRTGWRSQSRGSHSSGGSGRGSRGGHSSFHSQASRVVPAGGSEDDSEEHDDPGEWDRAAELLPGVAAATSPIQGVLVVLSPTRDPVLPPAPPGGPSPRRPAPSPPGSSTPHQLDPSSPTEPGLVPHEGEVGEIIINDPGGVEAGPSTGRRVQPERAAQKVGRRSTQEVWAHERKGQGPRTHQKALKRNPATRKTLLGPRLIPQQVVTASFREGEEDITDAPCLDHNGNDLNGNKVAGGEGGSKEEPAQSLTRE